MNNTNKKTGRPVPQKQKADERKVLTMLQKVRRIEFKILQVMAPFIPHPLVISNQHHIYEVFKLSHASSEIKDGIKSTSSKVLDLFCELPIKSRHGDGADMKVLCCVSRDRDVEGPSQVVRGLKPNGRYELNLYIKLLNDVKGSLYQKIRVSMQFLFVDSGNSRNFAAFF